jgi:hypothetical protein
VLRTKRRTILFISALIVALGVVLFVGLAEGPPVAVAADGRRITIEKVTFGTHHSFTQGKWWVRLLKSILGKRWAAQRGGYQTRITNDVPALMVWTRWEGLHRSNSVAVTASMVDERGTESELVLNHWNAIPRSPGSNSQPAYVAWLFNNFPRRASRIRLRIYGYDKRYLQLVELAFPNPVRNRFREWRGSDLPVQVRTNGTEFTLRSVQQTSNALWLFSFGATTNARVDPTWQLRGITASSASGNIISTYSNLAMAAPTLRSEFSTLNFHHRHALWPEEPVWRFTAEFYRTTDFRPNELWTLTNIAILPRGTVQLTTNLASYANQRLTLKLVSRPPAIPYPPPATRNADLRVIFEVAAHVFLVAATDDQGKEVKTEVDVGAPPSIYSFGLAIPTGAQSINLTFAIRKPTVVTFDVAERSLTRVRDSTK